MNKPESPAPPTPPGRIDAHQHFWRIARGDYRWLHGDAPALAPLRRDFEPHQLQPLLAAHGIAQTVLVQAADSAAETDFLLELAARHELIGGVVGWADLTRDDSLATLERWVAQPKFKGVRPMLQDLPQPDWILHAPRPALLEAIERLGLRFDALVKPAHLEALLGFVQRHPALPVVIDHAAKPALAQGWSAAWGQQWQRGIAALARQPQVCCKLSGLLTEAAPLASVDEAVALLRPVWDTLLAHFGPERLMWGSDWPVLTLAASYERWVAVSEALIGALTPAQQQAVWHDNAARFYALDAA